MKLKEGFESSSSSYDDTIKRTISNIYRADIDAMRNLSSIASQLTTSNYLRLAGNLVVDNSISLKGSTINFPNFAIHDGGRGYQVAPRQNNSTRDPDWVKGFWMDTNGLTTEFAQDLKVNNNLNVKNIKFIDNINCGINSSTVGFNNFIIHNLEDNSLIITNRSTTTASRLNLAGGFKMNSDGNVRFDKISTNNLVYNMPNGWTGGIRTYDIYAGGCIACGPSEGTAVTRAWMNCNGDAGFNGEVKIGGALDFGYNHVGREENAGKIYYNTDALYICGRGNTNTTRQINLYDNVNINGTVTASTISGGVTKTNNIFCTNEITCKSIKIGNWKIAQGDNGYLSFVRDDVITWDGRSDITSTAVGDQPMLSIASNGDIFINRTGSIRGWISGYPSRTKSLGATMINGSGSIYSIAYSINNYVLFGNMNDIDDHYVIMPGFKLVVYEGADYAGNFHECNNTLGIIPKFYSVPSTPTTYVNKGSSCKLYFWDNEVIAV
jgi:hypothetical protein